MSEYAGRDYKYQTRETLYSGRKKKKKKPNIGRENLGQLFLRLPIGRGKKFQPAGRKDLGTLP